MTDAEAKALTLIKDLMSDGRERTINDIAMRLKTKPEVARAFTVRLLKARALTSSVIGTDGNGIRAYRGRG